MVFARAQGRSSINLILLPIELRVQQSDPVYYTHPAHLARAPCSVQCLCILVVGSANVLLRELLENGI